MADNQPQSAQTSLLDYLRLFRIANVFTAIADVTMGFLCAQASLQPWLPLLCLVIASSLLYTAGMVLNDVYDVDVDARLRPERPLPAGRIPVARAKMLGFILLLMGIGAGWMVGFVHETGAGFAWRSGVVASLLALAVLLYDIVLKKTAAGPVAMGACRFLNVLLGASVGVASVAAESWAGFQPHEMVAAAGIGIYVVGVTSFARHEATESSRPQLFSAAVVMAAGIVVLALVHRLLPAIPRSGLHLQSEAVWWALLALLAFTILRRAAVAIADPRPRTVQLAVKVALLSIIVLDAAVALEVSHWFYAVGLLALLAPTVILGRWVPTT